MFSHDLSMIYPCFTQNGFYGVYIYMYEGDKYMLRNTHIQFT